MVVISDDTSAANSTGDELWIFDAADLAQFPLVHCWRMQWQALWLDHCPQDKYALVMPILRRETILLERQVLPAPPLAVQQQQALLLGVPYPQVYSPWLSGW